MPATDLKQFESECQAASPNQREGIALTALDFLMKSPSNGGIGTEIDGDYANNKSPAGDGTPLPDGSFELNEALCAQLEARLAIFFPSILHLKETLTLSAFLLLMAKARALCEKVDAWRNFPYWAPLLDFLKNATEEQTQAQWKSWRSAAIAQQKARVEIGNGDFERAKSCAIYGLQCLGNIPDRRLYLDLCSRVENAIAEGKDACACLAAALGDWVVSQSRAIGHYLRAVGMLHNLGNQHLIAGKNADAVAALELAQQLCNAYWPIQDMSYYEVNLLERLARAYLNRGEAQKASDYLERFGVHARQPRQKTLYSLGKGYLALYAGDPQKAQQEFETARQSAQGNGNPPDDFFNLWSAYMSLALSYLKRTPHDTKSALKCLQQARDHCQTGHGFDSVDREIHEDLIEAEAKIKKGLPDEARTAFTKAQNRRQDTSLDSPRRHIQLLFAKALLPENASQASQLRAQALQEALNNGFNPPNIGLLEILICG